MFKTYVFVNVSTKRGILQLVLNYDKNTDFISNIQNIESYVFYTEVHDLVDGKYVYNMELSKFSNTYYMGYRMDDNHVISNSGKIYELSDNDEIVGFNGVILSK